MALVEGVKYGLSSVNHHQDKSSSNSNINKCGNKKVIFVKLTDSALRAIEDFLRFQNKTGQQATLKFLGNDGKIHIPSTKGNDGHSFEFSLSSNADIEGPQGRFECIQQCGSRSLESMGPLPFKMRIHAKDDVYETTRQRMKTVEEERKLDCVKEVKIKGGTDIKKKLGYSQHSSSLPSQHNRHNKEQSPIFTNNNNHNNQKQPSTLYNNNYYNHNKKLSNGIGSSTNSNTTSSSNNTNNNHINNHSMPSLGSNGNIVASHNQIIQNNQNNKTNDKLMKNGQPPSLGGVKPINVSKPGDVSKRPLRERLVQMLAVRPYKKPELLSKLYREGMKEKDKKPLMTTLQSVAFLKDNEYQLIRGVWNDVQEDWPFYSEQERQLMKRKKPANLTPVGSDSSVSSVGSISSNTSSLSSPRSNVSTGSGHSPSSYNKSSSISSGAKRYSEALENSDGPSSKKQRISHFKRPNCSSNGQQPPAALGLGSGLVSSNSIHHLNVPGLNHQTQNHARNHSHNGQHYNVESLSPLSNGSGSGSGSVVPAKSPRFGLHDVHNNANAEMPSLSPNQSSSVHEGGGETYSPTSSWRAPTSNGSSTSGYSHGYDMVYKSGKEFQDEETDSIDSGNGSSASGSGGLGGHSGYNGHSNGYSSSHGNGSSMEINVPIKIEVNNSEGLLENYNINQHHQYSSTTNGNANSQQQHNSLSKHNGSTGLTNGYNDKGHNNGRVVSSNGHSSNGGSKHSNSNGNYANSHGANGTTTVADHTNGNNGIVGKKVFQRNPEWIKVDREWEEELDKLGEIKPCSKEWPSSDLTYVPIKTLEQRAQYKKDFNSEYNEYRDLHSVIEKVSKKFAQLEERLLLEERGSDGYENIKEQIVSEYHTNKNNTKYQVAKLKFNYLHKKLSHIKQLVLNYDNTHIHNES